MQPIDLIKVRIQVFAADSHAARPSPFVIVRDLVRTEGPLAIYSGLSAALTRQVIYTGSRLGLYDVFTEKLRSRRKLQVGHEDKLPPYQSCI